jgi:hypothetical protein
MIRGVRSYAAQGPLIDTQGGLIHELYLKSENLANHIEDSHHRH